MAEKDALANFDFDTVIPAGKWLKFQADKPVTIRVLTVDPVVSNKEFTDKKTGEVTPRTQFSFIVYNFTDDKAQILQASPAMARKIGDFHNDEDFGANIRNIDLKIMPTGEGLERRYDIQILPKTRQLTNPQIKEAQEIDLDKEVQGTRMSQYNPSTKGPIVGSSGSKGESSGYEKAKAAAGSLKREAPVGEEDAPPERPDIVIEDIGDEPINLDDIPF